MHPFTNDMITRRSLLPGIGDHNPDRAEVGPQANHASGEKVQLGPHLVPPKQKNRQKTRLQKEREDALRRQGASENVTDIS